MNTSQYLLLLQFQFNRRIKINENLSEAWRRNNMLFLFLLTTVCYIYRDIPVHSVSKKENIKGTKIIFAYIFQNLHLTNCTQKYFRQNFILLNGIWSGKVVVICTRLFHEKKNILSSLH
jgi:hypothetical protein